MATGRGVLTCFWGGLTLPLIKLVMTKDKEIAATTASKDPLLINLMGILAMVVRAKSAGGSVC